MINGRTGLAMCLVIAITAIGTVSCGSDPNNDTDITDVGGDQGIGDDTITDVNGPDVTGDTDVIPVDTIEEITADVIDVSDAEMPFKYPDAAHINAVRNSPVSLPDEPYRQKFAEFFRTTDVLPTLNINVMTAIDDWIFVGTADGVYGRQGDAAVFSLIGGGTLARGMVEETNVIDIAGTFSDERMVFITPHTIKMFDGAALTQFAVTEDELTSVTVYGPTATIIVGGKNGLYTFDEETTDGGPDAVLIKDTDLGNVEVRDVAVASDTETTFTVLAATANGVFAKDAGGASNFITVDSELIPDNNILSLAVCPAGLAIGTETGFAVATGETSKIMTAGAGALPYGHVISVACNNAGYLLGHEMGATWLSNQFTQKEYFYGLRWMADQIVYNDTSKDYELVGKRLPGIAIGQDDSLWLGGQFGASRIYYDARTLAEKEVVFDSMVPYFWRMDGFFSSDGYTPTPWDQPSEMILSDRDNDGLWTQMMVGGWCFAYAATGEEKYYDYAHKAMQNMYKLIDYPAITFEAAGKSRGFIARSIISQESDFIGCGGDFTNPGNLPNCLPQDTPCTVPCVEGKMNHYDLKVCCREPVGKTDGSGGIKEGMARWNPIEVDGKKYVWKADTSSDEIAGHFFGFPVYYDLCAKDDAERALVASYMADVAGYIANNAMNLIDLDGTRTSFGIFGPDTIGIAVDGLEACVNNGHSLEDCAGEYYGGGWLNSNEALSLLLATWHVTGDKFFYDVYENLVTEHKYYSLAITNQDTLTVTNPSIQNHSDHELAMLAYTTVLRYEPDPDRLAHWQTGFQFLYDAEKPERNPWWAAIAALSGIAEPDAASARRTLREIPDDLHDWLMNNCHRMDYPMNPAKDRFKKAQFKAVPPFDEIRTFWWNGNPYRCTDGGYGNSWNAPTVWLLPYYMAMYSGLITPPAN